MPRPREFDLDLTLGRALEVFWTNGYKNTSMEKLVSALGVNRASVYNTFGNKHDFFEAALNHYRNTRVPEFLRLMRREVDAVTTIRAFCEGLVELGGKSNNYRGCFVIGSLNELAVLEPELAKLCSDTLTLLEGELLRVVKRGQRRKEIRTDLPAEDLTTLLLSSAVGLMSKAKTKEKSKRIAAAIDVSIELIKPKGLYLT